MVVSNYFDFHPLPGEMIQFDEHIFQMGWFNHQLDNCFCCLGEIGLLTKLSHRHRQKEFLRHCTQLGRRNELNVSFWEALINNCSSCLAVAFCWFGVRWRWESSSKNAWNLVLKFRTSDRTIYFLLSKKKRLVDLLKMLDSKVESPWQPWPTWGIEVEQHWTLPWVFHWDGFRSCRQ